MHKYTAHLPVPEFRFAGFAWPKWVATLDLRPMQTRLASRKRAFTGEYYRTYTPNNTRGKGFYFGSDGMPGLRCTVVGPVFRADDDTFQGIVFRLPRSRGFIIGYTMGHGMTSNYFEDIYSEFSDAARDAKLYALGLADEQAEYNAAQHNEAETV